MSGGGRVAITTGDAVFSTSLQAAIDQLAAAGGGTVDIPAGRYAVDVPVRMQSGVRVVCAAGVEIDAAGMKGRAAVVRFDGTIGDEVALAAAVGVGDTRITTASPHGLAVGDLVQLRSQRNALSADAGERWRLGVGTPGAPACHFGEFVEVATVSGATGFTVAPPLTFPDYRPDASAETDPHARAAATVAKVVPVRDASWSGGRFVNVAVTSAFRSDWARGCRVEGVEVDKGAAKGSAVFWVNALDCEAEHVVARSDADLRGYTDADHADYNHFKTAGAQGCWFTRCEDAHGSQSFDFSYLGGSTPSLRCGVRNSRTVGARKNAMTSHPGSYMIDVTGNRFEECAGDGIAIRSRDGRIDDNTITGAAGKQAGKPTYGLSCFEGWARDNVLSGNHVEGFHYGLYEWDGGSPEEHFDHSGNRYTGNTVVGCEYGFYINPGARSRNTVARYTVIEKNTFRSIGRKFGMLEEYAPGVQVLDNEFHGPLGANGAAVAFGQNNPLSVVVGNRFSGLGSDVVPVSIGRITDTRTYPPAKFENTCIVRSNQVIGAAAPIHVAASMAAPESARITEAPRPPVDRRTA